MFQPVNRPRSALGAGLVCLCLGAPLQAQAQCVTPLQTFGYTGAIASYNVTTTGDYWLEAAGAEGGNHPTSAYRPGRGAIVGGKFHLTAGTSLSVLVGQQPSLSYGGGNGGGGGSFGVVAGTNPPQALVVGGGGAGSAWSDSVDKHGQAGTSGGNGTVGGGSGGASGAGGGSASAGGSVAGGGGLLGNGADGSYSQSGSYLTTGGQAFANGGAGGTTTNTSYVAMGGFGGGGGGSGATTSGGGGGYSGGGGGNQPSATNAGMGGGGGSFNAGADPTTATGATAGQAGHGQVRICSTTAMTPLTVSPATLTAGVARSAYGPVTLSASGGVAPYTWSGSSLPSGMSLAAGTGVLSGTPAPGTQGSYTITVSDSAAPTPRTQSLSLTIYAALALSPASLPAATLGAPYTQAITATGGAAPVIASVSGLPAGLSFNAGTGQIAGTPTGTAPVTVPVTITVTDSVAPTLTQTLNLTVNAAPVVAVPTLGEWALAVLGLLAAALGMRAQRRPQRA